MLVYDKSGEEHYNLISALHKSVRNSDPDAALYWLARMFAGGEDPLYLARRIVRMAVEDIGLAAPEALNLCLSAKEAIDFLGSPEGDLALAEAVVYLSLAPKSNSVYTAYGAVQRRDRAHAPGAGPSASAQRAHAPDEGARTTARAIATPTTKKARSPTWTACPTRSAAAATTTPHRRAGRNCWRNAWKRYGGSGRANMASNRRLSSPLSDLRKILTLSARMGVANLARSGRQPEQSRRAEGLLEACANRVRNRTPLSSFPRDIWP